VKPYVLSALTLLLAYACQAGERDIADRLRCRGAEVGRADGRPGSPVTRVTMPEQASDADLSELCELRRLAFLDLSRTGVSDDGLAAVASLRCLDYLILSRTRITDAGLRHLERMDRLHVLLLRDCPNVTDAGVARLKKALPGCRIVR
jgi:hypothetical protein